MLTPREFVEAANNAESAEDLSNLLIRDMREEGYDNLSFRRVKAGELLLIHCASLPEVFLEAYFANQFMLDDPLVATGLASNGMFHWTDLETKTILPKRQREVLQAFRDLGVHSGISFPFHGPDGTCDLVGLSQRNSDPLDPKRLVGIEVKLKYTRWRYWELRQKSSLQNQKHSYCTYSLSHKRGPPEMMAHHCRALVFIMVAAQRWQNGFTRFNKDLLKYVSADDLEFLLSWGLVHELPDDGHFYYYFAPTVLGINHLSCCTHVPEFRRQVWEMEVGHPSKINR